MQVIADAEMNGVSITLSRRDIIGICANTISASLHSVMTDYDLDMDGQKLRNMPQERQDEIACLALCHLIKKKAPGITKMMLENFSQELGAQLFAALNAKSKRSTKGLLVDYLTAQIDNYLDSTGIEKDLPIECTWNGHSEPELDEEIETDFEDEKVISLQNWKAKRKA